MYIRYSTGTALLNMHIDSSYYDQLPYLYYTQSSIILAY